MHGNLEDIVVHNLVDNDGWQWWFGWFDHVDNHIDEDIDEDQDLVV